MRAIVVNKIGGPEFLAVEDRPAPSPAPGEVVIDMKAAAVNFPDLLVIEGKYQTIPPLPFIPGKEGAGVVSALGTGVTGLKAGDRVMVQAETGTFAEQFATPADHCFPMPDGLNFEDAAAIGIAYQTAHFALFERAALKPGETVMVTAATGSVGIAAMQLAKAAGCTVLAAISTPSKSDLARENGADHVIDLTAPDLRNAIRDQVKAATGGGVDVIVEMVGGAAFDGAIRCLNWCGRIIVVGFTGGAIASLKTNYTLLKNISVIGLSWSDYRDHRPDLVRKVQDEIFVMQMDGRIHVPVQAVYPMEDYLKAFDIIRQRQVRGKVVLRMG